MEDLERYGSPSDVLKAAIQAELRAMLTTLPGIVDSSDQHNAKVNSAVAGVIRLPDGTMKQVTIPPFDTLPVQFAGGGKTVRTHPIKKDDEGILVFCARALDSWRQSGGVQNPIDTRQHNPSDAFYIPGVKSDPNKIKNVAPDADHTRSLDGKITNELHPDKGTTTKVVDPSDGASDPFNAATIFHATTHGSTDGIVQTAKDASNTFKTTLARTVGFLASIVAPKANHILSLTPLGGHQVNVTDPTTGKTHSLTIDPQTGISLASNVAVALSAPPGGLGLPSGGVGAGALGDGAAASNVGPLGGDLSGTLPEPHVIGLLHIVGANALPNAASDGAAASAGVLVGALYRNGSTLCVRIA